MNVVFVFVFGLIIGSFLNVCIYRIPRGESIAFPPSHCTNCNTKIKWYDLIPIVSYIILKGKCRHCGEKISIVYPIIEALNALLWVIAYLNYGFTLSFFKCIFLISLFIVIALIDYNTQDIYFNTIIIGIIGATCFIIIESILYRNVYQVLNYVIGGVISSGIICIIILITKGMGWGDAEICLIAGLFLGFPESLFMLLISFVVGGIISVVILALKKKKRKDAIAFAPFIAIGSVIMCIYGIQILTWYIQRFLV